MGAWDMAEETPRRRRSWRSVVPAPLRHGVTIFLVLLVVEYFVVPRFVVASHSLYLLERLNYAWLVAGVIFEATAFFTFGLLTRTLLPADGPSLSTVVKIDMSATAIAHVLPAGSAGSAGLGYRLLTTHGVDGKDAGFAMATQSLGSTVLLNILLWCALVISIPLAGFNPTYVTVALAGMLVLLAVAGLITALTFGEERAVRVVRAIGGRVRFLGADRLENVVRHIGMSIRELAHNKHQLRTAALWATVNWLADAASLWAFVFAFGKTVSPIYLFVAYGIANVLAAIPITPGGLGIVETVATSILAGFGVPTQTATFAVIGWRLFNFWMPIPIGAASYLSLKAQRGTGLRAQHHVLSNMAVEATTVPPGTDGSLVAAVDGTPTEIEPLRTAEPGPNGESEA
jgi:uncharacterized protein (TIRG00374 family)